MFIQLEGYYIRDLEKYDIWDMKKWGVHENTLFCDYNLAELSSNELYLWYLTKKRSHRQQYYSLFTNEGFLCGYLGIKEISLFKRSGELGIVLDPHYCNQKIGRKSISALLDYYFDQLGFREIHLDVNLFNIRAIRCYKALGFIEQEYYYALFENQGVDFEDPFYAPFKEFFKLEHGLIYSKILRMSIKPKQREEKSLENTDRKI